MPALQVGQPFNPYKLFTGLFVPECLARYRELSCGAKLVYGRLARYAGENGECWPAMETVGSELGMGRTQARTYVHELRDERFIAIEERPGTSDRFKFLWHEAFAGEVGETRKRPPLRKTGGPPVRKTGGVPLRKTGGLPLRKTGAEESQLKESHPQESQVKRNQIPSSAEAKVKNLSPNHFPDDDEQTGRAGAFSSPWDEIRAAYRSANNGIDVSAHDERWLKEWCELRGVEIETLAELLRQNPLGGFKSPMAGLKWLVKNAKAKSCSAAEAEHDAGVLLARLTPEQLQPCARCGNTGWVLDRREGERPVATNCICGCRMGKELEAVERRKALATASANILLTVMENYHDQNA
jgi:hypothetical protein